MKAIEITLSTGQNLTVHEPRTDQMGVFLRAMPGLMAMSKAMEAAQLSGEVFVPINLPDAALEVLWPLLAAMSDMPEPDVRSLPVWDGLALFSALGELTPNFTPPKAD